MIAQAREGNAPTLGVLLEQYRNYLRVLARIEIGQHLQGKIVEDLKLNANQRKRLTDLLQTINQPKSEPQNMSLEERQSKFVERVRTNDALLAKILTPAQFVRLRQIALQC